MNRIMVAGLLFCALAPAANADDLQQRAANARSAAEGVKGGAVSAFHNAFMQHTEMILAGAPFTALEIQLISTLTTRYGTEYERGEFYYGLGVASWNAGNWADAEFKFLLAKGRYGRALEAAQDFQEILDNHAWGGGGPPY